MSDRSGQDDTDNSFAGISFEGDHVKINTEDGSYTGRENN